MKLSKWWFIPLGVLLIAGMVWVYVRYLAPPDELREPIPTASQPSDEQTDQSGVISAEGKVMPGSQAVLGFTQAGRVAEVLVAVGERVQAEQPLIRLEDASLVAAVDQAQAAVELAQANLEAARIQAEQANDAARAQVASQRTSTWSERPPAEFDQPAWYFNKQEIITAAQAELELAGAALREAQVNLQETMEASGAAELVEIEERLAQARESFKAASTVLEAARSSPDQELRDEAQSQFDVAQSRLEALQEDYDALLEDEAAADLLEARASLAVADERYQTALDRLDLLQSGTEALDIQAAEAVVRQFEANLASAQAAFQAAQTAWEGATLHAPVAGSIARLDVTAGESVSPGLPALTLADLSTWLVETTDLSENDVVLLTPGMQAVVTLEALPNQEFPATIQEIALVGEDSRGSVIYAVQLAFDPGEAAVRWGMTAFVEILIP